MLPHRQQGPRVVRSTSTGLLSTVVVPGVIGDKVLPSLTGTLTDLAGFYLLQPNDLNHDNTNGTQQTGTGAPNYTGALLTMKHHHSSSTAGSQPTGKIRLA